MPGHYIHIAASDAVADQLEGVDLWRIGEDQLPNLPGPAPNEVAALAKAHPSYYAFGAVGPDLFFFLPDFRRGLANPLIRVLEFGNDLYELLDEWILERWERYFGPVGQNIEEAISRLTGDLSSTVSDILGSLVSIGATMLLNLGTQSRDWWGLFSLGLNKGYDNQDFFWSDMLHYRKTSRFARALWELAQEKKDEADPNDPEAVAAAQELSDKLSAYALGYMAHLGTDVAGHGFVNEKCGGPFRTHWQRHHLIENHMDARCYTDDHGTNSTYEALTKSALHYRIAFSDSEDGPSPPPYQPGDNSLRGLYVRRRHLDLDSELPEELAELLFEAMEQAYDTGTDPQLGTPCDSPPRILAGDGRPSPGSIQDTYLLLFRYMKNVMLDGFDQEKPSPPEVFPNLDFPQLTDPADDPPNEADDEMSLLDYILAILRFLLWLVAIAVWLATILPAIALDIITYLPRLLAYYCIQLPLYYILKAQRRVMVMTGYLLPQPDEIDLGLIRLCTGHQDTVGALFAAMDDVLGGLDEAALANVQAQVDALAQTTGLPLDQALARVLGELALLGATPREPLPDPNYPHRHELDANNEPVEYHHPWLYPTTKVELAPTFAGPHQCGELPHVLLDVAMPGSQAVRARLERAGNPAETDQLSRQLVTREANLGDPVHLSSYLLWQLTRTDPQRITDWNADADRGYAYKCWDWNRHPEPGPRDPHDEAHHVFLDADRHEYLEPCTPPPQSDRPPHNANRPLEIHYCEGPDPGCAPVGGPD